MVIPSKTLIRFTGVAACMVFGCRDRIIDAIGCDALPAAESRATIFANRLPPLPPQCRRIYLLRHGETDWNKQGLMQGGGFDIPLNEDGRKQAALVAQELSEIPLSVVASSHLQRARETADAVIVHRNRNRTPTPSSSATAAVAAQQLVVMSGLGEMRFGDFEGLAIRGPEATGETKKRFERMKEQMERSPDVACPGGGESTRCVETRARTAVDEILKQSLQNNAYDDSRHIAIVAHGRTNKILLASLLEGDASQFGNIQQGNACINVIDFNESSDTWCKVLINYVDHTVEV